MEEEATAIAAVESCSASKAILVEPMTRLHTLFLNTLLVTKNIQGFIWTGYRRNIFNLTGQEDKVFSSSTNKIVEIFNGDLDMTENGKL